PVLYVIGLVTAVLTAFYMTRQVIMVFFGKARWESHAEDHGAHGEFRPHESPAIMLFPLVVLAGLSVVGGAIQLPSFGIVPKGWRHHLEDWLHPVVAPGEAVIKGTGAYDAKSWLALLAIACAALGILAAIAVYAKGRGRPIEPDLLARGWRYDETVSAFMGGPGRKAFDAVARFDAAVVDGAVNGTGVGVRAVAERLRRGQTGFVRNYSAIVVAGVLAVLAWFVIVRGVL
ncbi:MAG: NADH-quinone oxidoreductase subunit L, partial [Ilumatobacter sp.]